MHHKYLKWVTDITSEDLLFRLLTYPWAREVTGQLRASWAKSAWIAEVGTLNRQRTPEYRALGMSGRQSLQREADRHPKQTSPPLKFCWRLITIFFRIFFVYTSKQILRHLPPSVGCHRFPAWSGMIHVEECVSRHCVIGQDHICHKEQKGYLAKAVWSSGS